MTESKKGKGICLNVIGEKTSENMWLFDFAWLSQVWKKLEWAKGYETKSFKKSKVLIKMSQ